MKLPEWIRRRLASWAYSYMHTHTVDFVLADDVDGQVYLYRWHIIPPNPVLSLYVHFFANEDFGRHLHDHRSGSLSLVLDGWYDEIFASPRFQRAYGKADCAIVFEDVKRRAAGDIVYRKARMSHMVTKTAGCVTIFITGPSWRTWGFWVDGTWVPHQRYIAEQAQGPK